MQQRASELKEEVKKMLGNVKNYPLKEINMIDAIQRLGVACHFEKEMAYALLRIYNEDKEGKYESDDDLHAVALRFRLLRQEGNCVSPNVFIKFKDEKGNFKETLAGNIRGLLSLYEASHFVIHGEDILDEANAFARKHLKLALPNLNSPLSSLVQLALELPVRKSIEKLLSRYYISIYQEEDERNDILLEFAKLDFNLLQSLHKEEIREISMWWKHWDFGAKLPFIRDRVVECYFWILGVYPEQQYSRARRITTKCISLTSILDDIYDAYGTLEELELYTNAIERWDRSMVDQLPDFMKLHFVALLDAVDEFEEELALEEKSYRITFLKDAFKEISKYYLIEAQWFNTGYVPTYEEYMNVALITCGYKLLTLISFVGLGDIATKDAFEWARSMPKLIKAVSMVNRLRDDITSNKSEDGEIIDCVDIYKQPAFDHPLLKNHTIQMRPSFYDSTKISSSKPLEQLWHNSGSCPKGTIPILRTRKEDLLRDISFGRKINLPSQLDHAKMVFEIENHGAQAKISVWNVHVEESEHSTASIFVRKKDKFDLVNAGLDEATQHYGMEIIAKELQHDVAHPDVHKLFLAVYKSFMEVLAGCKKKLHVTRTGETMPKFRENISSGYMAPEYAMDGLFSVKSDVFSFGLLLLEILSGRKNSRSHLADNAQSLLAYAWRLWCDEKVMELIDPILIDSCPMDEVLRFVHIGLLCIQEDATDRPTMSSVVLMLGSKSMTLPHPSEPPLYIRKREITSEESSSNAKTSSNNEVTISAVKPR